MTDGKFDMKIQFFSLICIFIGGCGAVADLRQEILRGRTDVSLCEGYGSMRLNRLWLSQFREEYEAEIRRRSLDCNEHPGYERNMQQMQRENARADAIWGLLDGTTSLNVQADDIRRLAGETIGFTIQAAEAFVIIGGAMSAPPTPTASAPFVQSPTDTIQMTGGFICAFRSSNSSGMYTNCAYNCAGGVVIETIPSRNYCPISIRR